MRAGVRVESRRATPRAAEEVLAEIARITVDFLDEHLAPMRP